MRGCVEGEVEAEVEARESASSWGPGIVRTPCYRVISTNKQTSKQERKAVKMHLAAGVRWYWFLEYLCAACVRESRPVSFLWLPPSLPFFYLLPLPTNKIILIPDFLIPFSVCVLLPRISLPKRTHRQTQRSSRLHLRQPAREMRMEWWPASSSSPPSSPSLLAGCLAGWQFRPKIPDCGAAPGTGRQFGFVLGSLRSCGTRNFRDLKKADNRALDAPLHVGSMLNTLFVLPSNVSKEGWNITIN